MCKLNKAIYGLKQAPHSRYKKLSITLQRLGFHFTTSDPSLFVHFTHYSFLFVLIYVDDIIITGSVSTDITTLISILSYAFALKDLGLLHQLLCIDVFTLHDGSLNLLQCHYIHSLLQLTHMLESHRNLHPRLLYWEEFDPRFWVSSSSVLGLG